MANKTRRFHFTRTWKIITAILIVLIIFRLFLPSILLHYCNKTLANMHGYYGHVNDIDVALYRGAYQINDMYLNKLDSATKKQTEFFKVKTLDLSVEWKALFHGSIAGELVFDTPKLVFTKDKAEVGDVKKDTNDFRKVIKNFMPLKINRFEIDHGSIHYSDPGASPKVDVALTNLYVLAQNLKNVDDNKTELPSPITAHADVYGGTLSLNMKMDALAAKTRFDMNADVKNVNLVQVNDFLKAYGKFDVSKGTLGLYTEFAAKNGQYTGYVKPVIKDLKVLGPEDRQDNFFQKVWEAGVGGVGNILENRKKEQIGTKVPIQGSFGGSHTDVMEAIWELLKNAFIQALMPSVDNQININSVGKDESDHKTLLQKIFGGGKKDEKDKKSKKN